MNPKTGSYFNGEMNRSERLSFLREVNSDKELKEEFIRYRNMGGLISLADQTKDRIEGNLSYPQFMETYQRKVRRKKISVYLRYAAVIALLFSTAWSASYYFYFYAGKTEITFNTLSVPAGQRASLLLSDGTEVWLNARSTLTYPSEFGKDTREVKLSGEAYFNVTCNKQKPFLVSSHSLNIKVLGTSFHVYDYVEDDLVNINLVNGSIAISEPGESRSIIMEPNETLHYKNGEMKVSKGINEEDFLWIQGIYVFNKTNLLDIVKKLELYYDTRIIVKNPNLSKHVYTGKFRQRDSVMGILQVIQEIHNFKIVKDEENNIIILE
ncbi:MAG: FecR family protein [Tannerellaceae bacterium]|jgi:ferric-dicitrate binding protein FerR (iron transport regulator)|nr:FecR family protein [Tannerellaceae bacterium]